MGVPKVFVMGKEVPFDSVPEATPSLESAFKKVLISPKSIDLASQFVPEEYWRPTGLYTWLEGRANLAFGKLKIGATDVRLGRLHYFFKIVDDHPNLEKIILK